MSINKEMRRVMRGASSEFYRLDHENKHGKISNVEFCQSVNKVCDRAAADLKNLSPESSDEYDLDSIATVAKQLGIRGTENVEAFAETTVKLAATGEHEFRLKRSLLKLDRFRQRAAEIGRPPVIRFPKA